MMVMTQEQEGCVWEKHVLFSFREMRSDEFMIPKEEVNSDKSEHNIDSQA